MPFARRVPPPWLERKADYGRDLQGVGSAQTTHLRSFKGSKLGAATRGRILTDDEKRAIEQDLRERGIIT